MYYNSIFKIIISRIFHVNYLGSSNSIQITSQSISSDSYYKPNVGGDDVVCFAEQASSKLDMAQAEAFA